MHLFVINPGTGIAASPHPYRGGRVINDYSSLIWTERFRDYGEFQMNIPRTASSADIFFPGLLLGIQESNQVMLAETQQEQVNDQGYRDVIVTGRTAESIIEDRVLWAPQGSTLTLARQYTYLDAALLYIWGAVQNSSTSDVGYTVARPSQISVNSKISDSIVTDSSKLFGTSMSVQKINVSIGQMGPLIRKFLHAASCGLRCIRPISSVNGVYSITVDPANGTGKGIITRAAMSGNTDKLRFDVYKGTDRSISPPTSDNMVYISEEAGHLDNVNVATTYREFITNAVHGVDSTHYYGSTTSLTKKGDFGIRHRYIDASQLVSGMAVADYTPIIAQAQKDYYQSHSNRAILDADLTTNTPFIFGTDYYLGDTVMLRYKTRTRRSLVNEYTRIEDLEGSRAYPGFLGWDEITAGAVHDW